MKKLILTFAVLMLTFPSFADTETTTYTKQVVPFSQAIDSEKLKRGEPQTEFEQQRLQSRQALEAKRNEVKDKINSKQEEYKKEQQSQAKRREEMQKQNELKRQELQRNINQSKGNVYKLQRQTTDYDTIRKNNAEDFTNLKNSVNNK